MDTRVDENTALLPASNTNGKRRRKPTPLPKLQIAIVLLLQVCEPLTALSIYPYINRLVSELGITGGDERRVGYYAGLIESLFFVTEAITVLQWSRISDHVGRKPILLIGLIGMSLSMLSFGLSRTFWGLVVSRCLCGLLNGNIGVMKSTMGELTNSSNRAEGFALMPVVWATGATLGPMMGGVLARPHERFPTLFSGAFWKEYPYFLPCVATSSFVFVVIVITVCFFKETVPKKASSTTILRSSSESSSIFNVSPPPRSHDEPIPLRQLLIYPVVISVANYTTLAFLNITVNALLPLFFAMPVEIGGLGFDPPTIGYIMGAYGAGTGIFQAFFFAKIIRYAGERRIFIAGIVLFLPIFMVFPIISTIAQRFGVTVVVWVLVAAVLAMMAFMDMAYGCIFMYVTASAPNKRSLGATNGLSQTTVSIARAIGPALSTSLFSLSVQRNILGGYAVYAILFVLSCCAVPLAACLPHDVWEEFDDST